MEHDEQSARSHPLEPGSEAPPGSPAEEANTPIVKRYKAAGVTVVWKPALCIHAKVCWKGLPEVFNPKARPWVNISGAEADRIITQVGQCPSGALSIEKKAGEEPAPGATSTRIEILPGGPAVVHSTATIVHPDGRTEIREGKVSLCRCGATGAKPFCDGSHARIGFEKESRTSPLT